MCINLRPRSAVICDLFITVSVYGTGFKTSTLSPTFTVTVFCVAGEFEAIEEWTVLSFQNVRIS